MRLLIVDDNARVRRMIAEVTEPLATDVIECSDGSQALHAYLLHRPDVVLMDISMGGWTASRPLARSSPPIRTLAS